jgi:hypothetical protein
VAIAMATSMTLVKAMVAPMAPRIMESMTKAVPTITAHRTRQAVVMTRMYLKSCAAPIECTNCMYEKEIACLKIRAS